MPFMQQIDFQGRSVLRLTTMYGTDTMAVRG